MPRHDRAKQSAWRELCTQARPAPVRIAATLASPLVWPRPWIALDELLVGAAAGVSPWRPGAREPVDVPLPLARDHRAAAPVWCCSALWLPDGARSRAGGGARGERLWSPAVLSAWALADPDQLRAMLQGIGQLGAAGADGYGRVRAWQVEPDLAARLRWCAWAGRLRRAMPHPDGAPQGVRPPYAYRRWWVPALGPGDPDWPLLGRAPADASEPHGLGRPPDAGHQPAPPI